MYTVDPLLAELLANDNSQKGGAYRELADTLSLLAEETRFRFLTLLLEQPGYLLTTGVTDIAELIGIPQSVLSHHLQLLRMNGLVESTAVAKNRFYRLTEKGRRFCEISMPTILWLLAEQPTLPAVE